MGVRINGDWSRQIESLHKAVRSSVKIFGILDTDDMMILGGEREDLWKSLTTWGECIRLQRYPML